MSTVLDLAVGMTRSWVALYTLGLPAELRIARRLEIDCDLWDQRELAGYRGEPPLGTAAEIGARAALGVLSDITWRVQAGLSARPDRSLKMNETLPMRALVLLGLTVAAFPVLAGSLIMVGLGGGDSSSNDGAYIWGIGSFVAGIGILAGLLLCTSRRLLGVGLVAAGSITIAAMWYWMLVITVPIGIALTAIAFFRGRQSGWPSDRTGGDRAGATSEGRWKWLLTLIGLCVAAVVGMWSYALSLEEWGDARTMIFGLGGMLAVSTAGVALVLLISDFVQRRPSGTNG